MFFLAARWWFWCCGCPWFSWQMQLCIGSPARLPGQPRCPIPWAGSPGSLFHQSIPACGSQERFINCAASTNGEQRMVTAEGCEGGPREGHGPGWQRWRIPGTCTALGKQSSPLTAPGPGSPLNVWREGAVPTGNHCLLDSCTAREGLLWALGL